MYGEKWGFCFLVFTQNFDWIVVGKFALYCGQVKVVLTKKSELSSTRNVVMVYSKIHLVNYTLDIS